jgi:hypothetical protein
MRQTIKLSPLPEKDLEDQEISRVNIEAIATNIHGTNLIVGFLCVGPMTHTKALKEKIYMFLLFNQMQRQTALRNVIFKQTILRGQTIEKVVAYIIQGTGTLKFHRPSYEGSASISSSIILIASNFLLLNKKCP